MLNSCQINNNNIDVNGNIEVKKEEKKEDEYRMEFAWFNICGFIYLHYAAIVGMTEVRLDSLGVFSEY